MTTSSNIDTRIDFLLIFDVENGNPNGDPDAGNSPRVDPETGFGLVSDVCLKRKLRNWVALAKSGADGEPAPGYDIYVKERAILNQQHARAYEATGLKKGDAGAVDAARAWMCQTFFDVRMFGAVMSTQINAGQVRGPVQITFARSADRITPLEQSITRMAVTTEAESKTQDGGNRTMGRKEIIPYALYVAHGFFSPHLARQTGFSADDLAVLRAALGGMFEIDRSAARGTMTSRRCIAFEHESALGNAPAQRLFERVRIMRTATDGPARHYDDYSITLSPDALPSGITMHEWI